ncbi:hypothetical protein AB0I59_32530 [Microtetraspora glauca]|uniref:Uncharacterized protein n=1 Tax=Microtetraspora glauca TaxID=1996 RepID=A0ABV3GP00_MICGL
MYGLQTQEPQEPFAGLWSRLRGFDPAVLSDLLIRRDDENRRSPPSP